MHALRWAGPVVLLIAALSGCTAPPRDGEPVRQSVNLAQGGDADELWEVAAEVLRRNRFALERVDRRAGVIVTHPELSEHFFEFWRHDVDTRYDWMEATVRPIRRRAIVTIAENAPAGVAEVTVEVQRETFSTPERQFNSSMAAFRMFGTVLPSTTGERITAADDTWIPAGRDLAMERYLLNRIRHAVGSGPREIPALRSEPATPEVEPM